MRRASSSPTAASSSSRLSRPKGNGLGSAPVGRVMSRLVRALCPLGASGGSSWSSRNDGRRNEDTEYEGELMIATVDMLVPLSLSLCKLSC